MSLERRYLSRYRSGAPPSPICEKHGRWTWCTYSWWWCGVRCCRRWTRPGTTPTSPAEARRDGSVCRMPDWCPTCLIKGAAQIACRCACAADPQRSALTWRERRSWVDCTPARLVIEWHVSSGERLNRQREALGWKQSKMSELKSSASRGKLLVWSLARSSDSELRRRRHLRHLWQSDQSGRGVMSEQGGLR